MAIALHPRYAEPGKVRVWIGITRQTSAPQVSWQLSSAAAPESTLSTTPDVVAPLAPVRPNELAGPSEARVYFGVFEFPNLTPGSDYIVRATAGTETALELQVRSLPSELPFGTDEWFN